MADIRDLSSNGDPAGSRVQDLVLPSGEKAITEDILDQSVREPRIQKSAFPSGLDTSLLWFVATAADEIEPWGNKPKIRDQQLRDFVPTESLFASALGVVISRNVGFDYVVEGPTRTAAQAHRILEESDMGEGWESLIAKLSNDLYCQDSGAFAEIVRNGDSPDSAWVGLNHLDASRCWHTGDPLKPVIYLDVKGEYHLLDWWNVYTLAELPAPHEQRYGLQFCALTRLLLAAQITKNIAIYKKEKTGGRNTRAIHLISGITTAQIQDALEQVRAQADSQGLIRFIEPLLVGSHDPKATVDVKTMELASLPDGFNEEDMFKHYISQIAMAFLSDYQDFAPLPGGNLGTSAQSQILHMKGRGKGPAMFMKLITKMMNQRVLPQNVAFRYQEQDIEAEELKAQVSKLRAEERKFRLESGEISLAEARHMAMEVGDLRPELFEAAGGLDIISPGETAIGGTEKPGATAGIPEIEGKQPLGQKEESEVSSSYRPFGLAEETGTKQKIPEPARAGPFEDERIVAERKLQRAVAKALTKIFNNVKKRLRRENRGRKELTDVPNDFLFWGEQKEEFMAQVGTQPGELLQAGAQQARQLGLAVSFDQVNQRVLDLSGQFTNQWWGELEQQTREGMRTAIQTHIESGAPIRSLNKNLEPLFGKARAEVIARTEVTRLYAEGNRAAYADSGIDTVEWRTVRDARVDPICDALQGKRMTLGKEEEVPPAHPRCRCWLAPVVCIGEKGTKEESCSAITKTVREQESGKDLSELLTDPSLSREEMNKRLRQLDPNMKKSIDLWTGKGGELRKGAEKILSGAGAGETAGPARVMLHSINASPKYEKLYRGIRVAPDTATSAFVEGETLDIALASASRSKEIANRFSRHLSAVGRRDSVNFTIQNSRGLPIENVSRLGLREQEVIVGGRYRIAKITSRKEGRRNIVDVILEYEKELTVG